MTTQYGDKPVTIRNCLGLLLCNRFYGDATGKM